MRHTAKSLCEADKRLRRHEKKEKKERREEGGDREEGASLPQRSNIILGEAILRD